LLTDPKGAPLPAIDRFQYVDGWPSVYGTAEAAYRLRDEAKKHPRGIRVVVHGRAERAVFPILRAYLMNTKGLELRDADLGDPETLARLREEAGERPTYLVVPGPLGEELRLLRAAEHLLTGRKPAGARVLEMYRLHAGGDART
jgi:hypothetical protein